MTAPVTKTKTIGLFVLITSLVAFLSGCDKEEPAVETVDLAQVPDLFEKPLQPNPLALTEEDVVISVDGEDITHGEIMQATQMRMMQMSQQVPPEQLSQLYPRVYKEMSEMLVANLLLTKAAEKSSLVVSDEAVAAEIAKIEANIPEGKNIKEMLAENDVDMDEWMENLKKQLLIGKLVEEKTESVEKATLVEASEFYEENIESFKTPETYTASHILLMTRDLEDDAKAEKKTQIEKIKADIDAGTITFAEAAKKYSEDPGSAQNGGEYKDVPKGQMVPEFEEIALTIELNAVSEIVETQFGYHLITVSDRQAEGVQSLADVKIQLLDYLSSQKKQEALVAYIEELKEKGNVVEHSRDFDAAAE